jgi:hypothetical protein
MLVGTFWGKIMRRFVRVGGGALLFGAMLAGACGTREKPAVTGRPAPHFEFDLERDVAAVLSDEATVLCVHPNDVETALQRLGATPGGAGTYRATLASPSGEPRALEFALFRTERPYLCSNRYRKKRQTPSPIVDLAAFMSASGKELCVQPKHQAAVLARLGAKPADAGRYVVLDSRGGAPVERLFTLKPTLAPILCAMGGDDDDPKPPPDGSGGTGASGGTAGRGSGSGAVSGTIGGAGGTPGAGAFGGSGATPAPGPGAQRCDEGEPPELCEGDGVWPLGPAVREVFRRGIYVVYDNANCNQRFAKTEGKCLPEGPGVWRRESMEEYRGCGRGTGFCVSAFTIVGVRRYYGNAACGGDPVKEEQQRAGACYEGSVADGWLADDPIFEDTFILFRNAACEAITDAFDRECEDSSNRTLGRYEQLHYDAWHACKKGSGYCAETNLRIGTRTYYDLREGKVCRSALQRFPIESLACK